jgi:hypothetical protein
VSASSQTESIGVKGFFSSLLERGTRVGGLDAAMKEARLGHILGIGRVKQ